MCFILQVLSSEREKHAATETELNMKNLGLADKLKEARGELTGMSQPLFSQLKLTFFMMSSEFDDVQSPGELRYLA